MADFTHETKSNSITPKITFYTNDLCPWAHRAAITLQELDLPCEKVVIDLETPRPDWYLKINPRGLVPAIAFSNGIIENEIITESGVVTQFLVDVRPSHLLPASQHDPLAPLKRARIAYFVDTWSSKVMPFMYATMKIQDVSEKEAKGTEWSETIGKEIEPLLEGASPFFGGSDKLTLAEVLTAPFVLRMYHSADGNLLPKSLRMAYEKHSNFSRWAKAIMAKESITSSFDASHYNDRMSARLKKTNADSK